MSSFFRFVASVPLVAAGLFASSHIAAAQTYPEQVLYSFCSQANCADGVGSGPLVQASDGNFYGLAPRGGNYNNTSTTGNGTFFKITPAGSLTTLYSFCSLANCADGSQPVENLIEGTDGNFYGATFAGGNANNAGTIFKITPSGNLSTLYDFCLQANCADGEGPYAGLVQGTDGNFYGTTLLGGNDNSPNIFGDGNGTVFKITPSGSFTTLHSFCSLASCADGEAPFAGLVQGTDGNFYGTTFLGADLSGTVFKITPSGGLATLYSFCSQANCTDGDEPQDSLVQGTDGNFYGTAQGGNANGDGTVFKITSSGSLTTLYTFCSQTGCADGAGPDGLIQGSDGNFYGATSGGGNDNNGSTSGNGTAFRISSSGSLTTVYSFCSQTNCTDGATPEVSLIQGADGNFYGATSAGGNKNNESTNGNGVIYKLYPDSALQPPVQLSTSPASVSAGASFLLDFTVANAGSDTLQYCFATNDAGNTVWRGVMTGKSTPQSLSLLASSAGGTYTYTLTCGGVESGFATLTVTGGTKNSSTTSLTAASNPVSIGEKAMLTATVTQSAGSATPTGKVTFSVDGSTIGSSTVNASGMAMLSASTNGIAPGNYPAVATYSGNANYDSSVSSPYTVTLRKAPTSTTVTAEPNPVTPPAKCTLTATVKRTSSGATGFATGSVTFSVGTMTIGTANLNGSGVATLAASTNGIAAGKYPVIAKYNGDASDVGSSSTAVTVTVQ